MDDSESKSSKAKIKTLLNKIIASEPDFKLHGATPELIQKLANDTRSKISIYEIVSQKTQVYKASSVKREYKFKFQNVSYNHVEFWSGKNEPEITESGNKLYDQLAE